MKFESIPASLAKYIEARDKQLAVTTPWDKTQVSDNFKKLLSAGRVTVGGRATCGTGKQDPTWLTLRAWRQVVAKASNVGIRIHEIPIKQANASPTRSGGFWEESDYHFTGSPE